MPAVSAEQYRLAQAVLSGLSSKMPKSVAREIVAKTPAKKRSEYMRRSNKKRYSNPSLEDAEEVSEGFHGRPVEYVEEVIEQEKYRENLAEVGCLLEIEVIDEDGECVPICFEDEGVELACGADRNQLFLVGGDQSLDLDDLEDMGVNVNPDLIEVGKIYSICYQTDKHHLSGPKSQAKGADYQHEFGDESDVLPTLIYDKLNCSMMIVGGEYEITDEGIKG